MTETGLALRENNDKIIKLIAILQQEKMDMDFLIERQLQEQGKIQNDIEKLTFKLTLLSKSLNQRIKARNDYEDTIKDVQKRYSELVAASGSLRTTVESKAGKLDEIMDKKIGTPDQNLPKDALIPTENLPDDVSTPTSVLQPTVEKPTVEKEVIIPKTTLEDQAVEEILHTIPPEDLPQYMLPQATEKTQGLETEDPVKITEILPSDDSRKEDVSKHTVYPEDDTDLPKYDRLSSVTVGSGESNTSTGNRPLLKVGSDRSFEDHASLLTGKPKHRPESMTDELYLSMPEPITKGGKDDTVQAFRDAYGRQHMVPSTPVSLRKFDGGITDSDRRSKRSEGSSRSSKRDIF